MIAALPEAKRAALIASIGMQRVGTAEDVAEVCAAFLASDMARYVSRAR